MVRGKRDTAYAEIRTQLAAGHQAFFIYPLVDDSEAEGFEDLKSAIAEAERLAREVFPEYPVALLHGRMSSEEKDAVMARFKSGLARVLVSTTVVEVGIDIPNATVMVVEHADRFGLSQPTNYVDASDAVLRKVTFFCFRIHAPARQRLRLEVLETNDGL